VLGENLPRRHCIHHKCHLPDPGANPGRRGGKPASNRLNYCAALSCRDERILLPLPGMEPRQASPLLCRRFYDHAVGTETAACLSSLGLAPVRTARRALVSAGPRAAEDLLRKPHNSLVKRFHGQCEVGGPVQLTVMSDLTADSS
jgi:hypothetical protein